MIQFTRKQRSRIILGGIIVLVLAAAAAIIWGGRDSEVAGVNTEAEQAPVIEDIDSCGEKEDTDERDLCYTQLAQARLEENICGFVTPNAQPACYTNIAKVKGEDEICSQIQQELGKNLCLKGIAEHKIVPQPCLKIRIPDMQLACVVNVAAGLDDPEICNLLGDRNLQEACVDQAKDIAE